MEYNINLLKERNKKDEWKQSDNHKRNDTLFPLKQAI